MIWEASVTPRIVYLEWVEEEEHQCSRVWSQTSVDGPENMGFFDWDFQCLRFSINQGPQPLWSFKCRNVPTLLLTSRESRLVAKKIYTRSFGSLYSPPTTWFNFALDTLYLDWGCALYDQMVFNFGPGDLSEDVKKVQNLALYNGEYPLELPHDHYLGIVLGYFSGVRNLTLVAPHHNDDDCVILSLPEESDVHDIILPEGCEEDLASFFEECFPELDAVMDEFWWSLEGRWLRFPLPTAVLSSIGTYADLPTETLPALQCRPIITIQRKLDRKLDLLQRRQDDDREMRMQRVDLSLIARSRSIHPSRYGYGGGGGRHVLLGQRPLCRGRRPQHVCPH